MFILQVLLVRKKKKRMRKMMGVMKIGAELSDPQQILILILILNEKW